MNRALFIALLLIIPYSLISQVSFQKLIVEKDHLVISSTYSYDGKLFATAGSDNRIIIRNSQSGEVVKSITTAHTNPLTICFSFDSKYIASGGNDKMIAIWDVSTGEVSQTLVGHIGDVTSLSFNHTDEYLVSGGKDKKVIVWNLSNGAAVQTFSGQTAEITSVAFHPNNEIVAAGSVDGKVYLWNILIGNLIRSYLAEEGEVKTISFSPNGNFLASAGTESKIAIWSAYSTDLESTLLGHLDMVEALNYSPDGKYIVSGGKDKYLILSEVKTGEIVFYTDQHKTSITSVAFNPNGKEFISSSSLSDTIRVWNASALNIEPKIINVAERTRVQPKPKPEIQWITENDKESTTLGYGVKYKILSEEPIEKVNLYVNNERQKSETSIDFKSKEWLEFESILYLIDGSNEVKADVFYSEGVVSSEVLKINFRQDLAEELHKASKARKVQVWLRESDEYEYKVSGTEGYLFHSEKLKVDEKKDANIGVELVPLKEDVAIVLNNITFPTNSADLTAESFVELDKVVELINANPRITIEISAHTDNVGRADKNQLLSERRAQSVVNYLLESNIPVNRLVAKGYGSKQPLVPNTTDENKALNRRVEFKIIDITEKK